MASLFPVTAMVVMILDGKTAFQGAYDGVLLCITTVIPSLFPLMVLASIITGSLDEKSGILLAPLGRLCRIPPGSEVLLLAGLMGGYPVGAQCVSHAYKNGQLSQVDAQRMLGFCSNAGPAFIFGMTSVLFERKSISFILWAIHILSALVVGMILPGHSNSKYAAAERIRISPTTSVSQCVRTTGSVCGWIVIFRVVITFCERWFLWLIPEEAAVLIQGILELSNGYVGLSNIGSEAVRFVVGSGMLAFGGLCVWMQTLSVTGNLHASIYLPGKLLQTTISCVISVLLIPFLFPGDFNLWCSLIFIGCCCALMVSGVVIYKKSSGNKKDCVV